MGSWLELVYTSDSKSDAERCAGSNPAEPTIWESVVLLVSRPRL